MRVLLSCYACSPHKGSEPGVGWNMAVALAHENEVWVLTREKNKADIDDYIRKKPIENLHFCYHDCSKAVKLIKKASDFIYYQLWNLSAISKVKRLIADNSIDIIHHITFNQYRSLSFGYFCDKPFVIGPVGGAELIDA